MADANSLQELIAEARASADSDHSVGADVINALCDEVDRVVEKLVSVVRRRAGRSEGVFERNMLVELGLSIDMGEGCAEDQFRGLLQRATELLTTAAGAFLIVPEGKELAKKAADLSNAIDDALEGD